MLKGAVLWCHVYLAPLEELGLSGLRTHSREELRAQGRDDGAGVVRNELPQVDEIFAVAATADGVLPLRKPDVLRFYLTAPRTHSAHDQ